MDVGVETDAGADVGLGADGDVEGTGLTGGAGVGLGVGTVGATTVGDAVTFNVKVVLRDRPPNAPVTVMG